MRELVVTSICDEDIATCCGAEALAELEDAGLVEAAMERAREYMWNAIDCSDWFWDCIGEAVENTLEGRQA